MTMDLRGELPPDFSHWEPASSQNAPHGLRLAVDKYGCRWYKPQHSGLWGPADRQFMSDPVWREHCAGQEKETTMTGSTTTSPAGPTASEVTGIRSAVTKMEEIAKTHSRISNAEGFLGTLREWQVGQTDQQNFLNAQEASKKAEAAWKLAADTIRAHNLPVGEAYRVSPGAANKHANTNE